MKLKIAVLCVLMLSSCQSTKSYEPFLPNAENFEVAKAKCQMMASSAERSVVAWGSSMYVASAQFANSLENAERVSAFLDQCMTAQGWRPVSAQQAAAKSIQNRREATVVLGTQELARECNINLNAKARKDLAELRSAADPQLIADARELGAEMLERKTKAVGRAKACDGARQLFRENGMS